MKVKIIKADKDKWYHYLVGKVRIAKGIAFDGYYVMRNYKTILRTIPVEDCELMEE